MLHDSPIYMEGKRDTVEIEIALQYNDSYTENVFRVRQHDQHRGRRHAPLRFPLGADALDQQFCFVHGMLKEQKDEVTITGDDVREGLVAVVSVKLPPAAVRRPDEGQTQ